MILTVLILSIIFCTIQSSFLNETSYIRHEIHKRSISRGCAGKTPKACAKFHPEEFRECQMCGLVNMGRFAERQLIIMGQEVKPPYKYPWMVAVMVRTTKVCGGAIISANYILTAAHCILKPEKNMMSSYKQLKKMSSTYSTDEMKIGFLTSTFDVEHIVPIENIIQHPKYHVSHQKNDIALIKLRGRITCDKYKNPICLPPANLQISKRRNLIIAGWGSTKPEDLKEQPKVLQEGRARKLDYSNCKTRFRKDPEQLAYCLIGVKNERVCMGDSGGPLVIKKKGLYVVAGVASMHTSKICQEGKPFVYTSVFKYVSWISEVMGQNYLSRRRSCNAGS